MSNPQIIRGAVCYRGGFAVDADGAPNAYSFSGDGLDYLANAGHPGNWWGVVTNSMGVPVEQGPADPCPGYLISPTSLVDRSKKATDPHRYVDSRTVPYVSVAKDILGRCGIKMGDVAMVMYGNKAVGAVCADVGPAHKYGEGSIALAEALGIPSNAKRGGVDHGVTWLIFPQGGGPWPRDFAPQAAAAFAAWGGVAALGDVA